MHQLSWIRITGTVARSGHERKFHGHVMRANKDTATVAWVFTIISAILISLAFSWRICRLRDMPVVWKLSLSFLDIAHFLLDIGVAVALMSDSDGSTPGCKAAAFGTLFSFQDCMWTLLLTDVIFLAIQSPLNLANNKPTSYHKSLFFMILVPQKFIEILLALLPQTPLEYFDVESIYLVKCFPFRRPSGKGSAYYVMLITMIWTAATFACVAVMVNICKIGKKQSTRVQDSSTTDLESVSIFRHGRRIAVLSVFQHAMWFVAVMLTTLTYYSEMLEADDTQTTLLLIFSACCFVHGLISLAGDFFGDSLACIRNVNRKAEPDLARHLKKLEYLGSGGVLVKMKATWEDGTSKSIEQGLLKVYQPENLKFWAQEIVVLGMLRKLQHPCLLRCMWTENENHYHEAMTLITGETISPSSRIICLELLNMGNLRGLFKSLTSPLSEKCLSSLLYDIASGLSHLHALSVLHANLNTKNIYIRGTIETQSLRASIGDFEHSQIAPGRPQQPLFERTNRLPFEQCDPRDLQPMSSRETFVSDMRSLALVILEMMSINCMLVYSDQQGQVSLENVPLTATMTEFAAQIRKIEAPRHSTPDFLMQPTGTGTVSPEGDGSTILESLSNKQIHNLPDVVRIDVVPRKKANIPVIYTPNEYIHRERRTGSSKINLSLCHSRSSFVECESNTSTRSTANDTTSLSSDSLVSISDDKKSTSAVKQSTSLQGHLENNVATEMGEADGREPNGEAVINQREIDIDNDFDDEISEEIENYNRYGHMKHITTRVNPRKKDLMSNPNGNSTRYFGASNYQGGDKQPWIILDSEEDLPSNIQVTSPIQKSRDANVVKTASLESAPTKLLLNSLTKGSSNISTQSMAETNVAQILNNHRTCNDDEHDSSQTKQDENTFNPDIESDCPIPSRGTSTFLHALLDMQCEERTDSDKNDHLNTEGDDSDDKDTSMSQNSQWSQVSSRSNSMNSTISPGRVKLATAEISRESIESLLKPAEPIDSSSEDRSMDSSSFVPNTIVSINSNHRIPRDISAKEKEFHLAKRTKARRHLRKAMGVRSVATTIRHNKSIPQKIFPEKFKLSRSKEANSKGNNIAVVRHPEPAVPVEAIGDILQNDNKHTNISVNKTLPVDEPIEVVLCTDNRPLTENGHTLSEDTCNDTDDDDKFSYLNVENSNICSLDSARMDGVEALPIPPLDTDSNLISEIETLSCNDSGQDPESKVGVGYLDNFQFDNDFDMSRTELRDSDSSSDTIYISCDKNVRSVVSFGGFSNNTEHFILQEMNDKGNDLHNTVSQKEDHETFNLLDGISEAVGVQDRVTITSHPEVIVEHGLDNTNPPGTNLKVSSRKKDDNIPPTDTSYSYLSLDKHFGIGIHSPNKLAVRDIPCPGCLHEHLLVKQARISRSHGEISDICSSSSGSHVNPNKTWVSSTMYKCKFDQNSEQPTLTSGSGSRERERNSHITRSGRSRIKMGIGVQVNTLFHMNSSTDRFRSVDIGKSTSIDQTDHTQYLPSTSGTEYQNRFSKVQGNVCISDGGQLEGDKQLSAIIHQNHEPDGSRRPSIESRQELFLNQPKIEKCYPPPSKPKSVGQTVVVDSDLVIDRIVSAKPPGMNSQLHIPRMSTNPLLPSRLENMAKVYRTQPTTLSTSERMLPTGVSSRHIRQCQKLSSALRLFSNNDFIPATTSNMRTLQERLRLVGSLGPIGTELLDLMNICWLSETPTAARVAKRLQNLCSRNDSLTEV